MSCKINWEHLLLCFSLQYVNVCHQGQKLKEGIEMFYFEGPNRKLTCPLTSLSVGQGAGFTGLDATVLQSVRSCGRSGSKTELVPTLRVVLSDLLDTADPGPAGIYLDVYLSGPGTALPDLFELFLRRRTVKPPFDPGSCRLDQRIRVWIHSVAGSV